MSKSYTVVQGGLTLLNTQNSYKVKVDSSEKGAPKTQKLRDVAVNYLSVCDCLR